MDRARVHEGIRRMRFETLLDRHERGDLSQAEAAEILGIGERTFRRWRDRLRDESPLGLSARRLSKPSSPRAVVEEIQWMVWVLPADYGGVSAQKHLTRIVDLRRS